MSQPGTLIGIYSLMIVASSVFGGLLPSVLSLTHVRTQLMLSFVGGLMLGVGLLHMLPHSYVETGSLDKTLIWTLTGLLGMFFLIRTFHFHQHGPAATEEHALPGEAGHEPSSTSSCQHAHAEPPVHALSWTGVAFGLALHTFIDGIALGAAVIADAEHRPQVWPAGVGVFLAIWLHKPLDALSITSLMQGAGWTRRLQQTVNAGFALMCPLGAGVFLLGIDLAVDQPHQLVGTALAISAGVFLCISLSDLLPEVQFHHHDRLKLSAALILGVLVAYGIRFLEPEHAHHPPSEKAGEAQQHVISPTPGEHAHHDDH